MLLQAAAGVLIVEGLAYALAPKLVEQMLEQMREVPLERRRWIGLVSFAAGLIVLTLL
ncbi:DUF2065 domain-containing protein [Marivivens donghaensis]|uniref:DUF2065 domain-containing protein n=2 Tax=Marivivens group TaxID=3020825 RepID=A0ABX0W0P4_9RHOB|nr:DUF2065 domain-containing protein [Marivivens donghaensis]